MDVLDTAAGAVVEGGIDRLLNAVFDVGVHGYGKALVTLKLAFKRYLENAIRDKNQIRTIATGDEDHPRHIRGANPLYVPIGLEFQKKEYDTTDIASLLAISNHLLVVGSGGMGKSMLMRYLFLKAAEGEEYIPILLDLNRIRRQTQDDISITELIFSCMEDYDVMLPKTAFETTLRTGKYLLLLDGLDEIPKAMVKDATQAIHDFCAKYPKNPCIVTSRFQQENTDPLNFFYTFRSMPLKQWQAVEMAKRIWLENERTREFCRQLNETLFEKHQSFAENPLLLNMMFLTFMHNGSIPDHMCDFYQSAYDALYNVHDNRDKNGTFRREFQCKSLDKKLFQKVFSYFCFQTYFREQYEFSKDDLLCLLDKSIKKIGQSDLTDGEKQELLEITSDDYLADLQTIVCMIIQDGIVFRFAHRLFQVYFAALYTARELEAENAKILFYRLLNRNECGSQIDFFDLLYQLDQNKLSAYVLESGLRNLINSVESNTTGKLGAKYDPDIILLKKLFIHFVYDYKSKRYEYRYDKRDPNTLMNINLLLLFSRFYESKFSPLFKENIEKRVEGVRFNPSAYDNPYFSYHKKSSHKNGLFEYAPIQDSPHGFIHSNDDEIDGETLLTFPRIESPLYFTDDERNKLYNELISEIGLKEKRIAICKWLADRDAKRTAVKHSTGLDDLLDIV